MTKLVLLLTVLSVAGCDSESDEYRRESGIVYLDVRGDARVVIAGTRVADADPYASEVSDAAPVVRAGIPFDVTVSTHTGSCDRAAPSEVSVEGDRATIAVYDDVFLGPCFLDGTSITPRTDRVTFAAAGTAEVVVRGLRSGGGSVEGQPYELRFEVVVDG